MIKVGSGSDHTTVYFRLGIPSVYFEYTYNKVRILHQILATFDTALLSLIIYGDEIVGEL